MVWLGRVCVENWSACRRPRTAAPPRRRVVPSPLVLRRRVVPRCRVVLCGRPAASLRAVAPVVRYAGRAAWERSEGGDIEGGCNEGESAARSGRKATGLARRLWRRRSVWWRPRFEGRE